MPRMPYRFIDIYTTGDKHHAAQNLDNELGSITDADQVIGHASRYRTMMEQKAKAKGRTSFSISDNIYANAP